MSTMFIDAPAGARSNRARRMFDALLRGAGIDAIAEEENLPDAVVETALREALAARPVTPLSEFAKLQIARLERLAVATADKAHRGEPKALDRTLKILDRLDRYHGFSRATPAADDYDDGAREKLLAKLNEVAERLDADGAGE